MTEEKVFAMVRDAVLHIVPDLTPEDVRPESTFEDLGANSLDRIDVVGEVTVRLGIVSAARDIADAPDLAGLARILHRRTAATA